MIIGTFRNIDDSYVGELVGFGFGRVPVVLLPTTDRDTYDVISETGSISFGTAIHMKGKKGGYLLVQIDSPMLPQPIDAVMELVPSRQGLYALEWQRPNAKEVTSSKDKKTKKVLCLKAGS